MEIFNALGSVFGLFGKLFNDVICYPLGFVLRICYILTGNYALSLVIFTLIIRFVLFPLAIKQQKSSAQMMRLKPKMDNIQKKYKKDQAKLQEEMSKLYQEEGYNPLSGCLPLLLQLPILYGLFYVVYAPLTYIMWYSQATVSKINTVLWPFIHSAYPKVLTNDPKIQLYLAKAMNGHMNLLSFLGNVKPIDFNVFGIDLSQKPVLGLNILVLIPIVCYLSSMASSWMSMKLTKGVQQGQLGSGMNGVMMILLMPLISAWFSLSMPAAVGFYWIISNLFMIIQVLILQKYFSLDRLAAQSQEKAEKRKQDILSGKVKPNRMAEMAKRAIEAQKQAQNQQSGKVDDLALNQSQEAETVNENVKEDTVKTNSKGNKSRSQIKDEQRKRLAQARSKEHN